MHIRFITANIFYIYFCLKETLTEVCSGISDKLFFLLKCLSCYGTESKTIDWWLHYSLHMYLQHFRVMNILLSVKLFMLRNTVNCVQWLVFLIYASIWTKKRRIIEAYVVIFLYMCGSFKTLIHISRLST